MDNEIQNGKSKGFLTLVSVGLVLAAFVWGTSFTIVRGVLDVVPVFYVLAIRFGIASVLIAAVFFKRLIKVKLKTILISTLIGVLLFAANYMQTLGLRYTTAGKSAFITTLYVVLVPFIMWLFYKIKTDKYSIIAAVLAFVGIGFICVTEELSIGTGDLLTMGCGVFFAVHIALVAHYSEEHDLMMLTLFQMVANSLIALVLAFIFDGPLPVSALTFPNILMLSYIGIFCSGLAFLMQNVGLKYLEAPRVSLLVSLESVFGVLVAVIIAHERPTVQMYIGFALVFCAVIISQTKLEFLRKRRTQNE